MYQLTITILLGDLIVAQVVMSRGGYTSAIDMWSVGCIFGELLQRVARVGSATTPHLQIAPLFAVHGGIPKTPCEGLAACTQLEKHSCTSTYLNTYAELMLHCAGISAFGIHLFYDGGLLPDAHIDHRKQIHWPQARQSAVCEGNATTARNTVGSSHLEEAGHY